MTGLDTPIRRCWLCGRPPKRRWHRLVPHPDGKMHLTCRYILWAFNLRVPRPIRRKRRSK